MEHSPRQSNFTTDRPVGVLMVFLAAVVFGYFSLGRLPVTLMPEMTYPTLTVRTEYPGSAPEEVENDISRPVEEQLGVISGLREISSISRAGVSDVVLEFVWGTSMVGGWPPTSCDGPGVSTCFSTYSILGTFTVFCTFSRLERDVCFKIINFRMYG